MFLNSMESLEGIIPLDDQRLLVGACSIIGNLDRLYRIFEEKYPKKAMRECLNNAKQFFLEKERK